MTGDTDYEDANTNPTVAETFAQLKKEREARRMGEKDKPCFLAKTTSGRTSRQAKKKEDEEWQVPRKEPAKKYVDRFMGNTKMGQEFPDRGQRYAVALNYVEKYYGKRGFDSVGARQTQKSTLQTTWFPVTFIAWEKQLTVSKTPTKTVRKFPNGGRANSV